MVIDAMFDVLDANGSGSISRLEMVKAIRASPVLAAMLGLSSTKIKDQDGESVLAFNQTFARLDADADGTISRSEFHDFIRRLQSNDSEQSTHSPKK